jgi:hypothetical protein
MLETAAEAAVEDVELINSTNAGTLPTVAIPLPYANEDSLDIAQQPLLVRFVCGNHESLLNITTAPQPPSFHSILPKQCPSHGFINPSGSSTSTSTSTSPTVGSRLVLSRRCT